MKITRLATHKLNSLFGSPQQIQETKFVEAFLLPVLGWKITGRGLTLEETEKYCSKCEEFGILILGLETLYESQYGLHIHVFEEYNEVYIPGWWLDALSDFKRNNVIDSIFPRIEIPEDVLRKYQC